MIRKNTAWSLLLIALSIWLFKNVVDFPTLPQQSIGAATFPQIIAGLLAACGAYVIFEKQTTVDTNSDRNENNFPYSLYCIYGLLSIPIGCTMLSEFIGFALAMALTTTGSMILFRRGRVISSIFICTIFSISVYVIFTQTLLVPLAPGPFNTAIGI